jgi:RNA polymerase sigma-70 factor (ECF subfamily)
VALDRPAGARPTVEAEIDALYRTESRRILATLIRLLGDFDLAEEALQDAFVAAAETWPSAGVPASPRPWLISAGRFRAIDRLRRRARFDAALGELAARLDATTPDVAELVRDREAEPLDDDRLRLLFTCCHPALAPDAQVAMTLREVCGLTTEAIAHAFLVPPATLAQRIVRAKARIKADRIPYEVPDRSMLRERLEPVLRVVYLLFTEGYRASAGEELVRADLADEAIRLGRELAALEPDSEVLGLLALMLLHDARRTTRTDADGELVLLADQDRSRWDQARIAEGVALAERSLAEREVGSYAIQASIAAVHAVARTPEDTDWNRVVGLYHLLAQADPSPVVDLNRAVAVSMRDGPEAGLDIVDSLLEQGVLISDHLAHAARADLLRRLGRSGEARDAYAQALALVEQEPERRFLQRRLDEAGLQSRIDASP